jgi:hypothetical protein
MSRSFCAVALPLAAALVYAMPANAEPRSDPLDAKAPVPALKYQSALAGYRRLGDEKPIPWKEANETAGRIGGWRAYAREAQASAPAAGAHGHKAK